MQVLTARNLAIAAASAGLLSVASPLSAATVCTLGTSVGGTSCVVGDGTFSSVLDEVVTGTGVFKPFLTIQANDDESGFNTSDENKGTPDTKFSGGPAGGRTKAVLISESIDATNGLKIVLDANEPNSASKAPINLTMFKLYATGTGDVGLSDLGSALLLYDLDALTDNTITLGASLTQLQSGSGRADMSFELPITAIAPLLMNTGLTNLVLHAGFTDSDSGFEEFAFVETNDGYDPSPVPLPAAAWMLLAGLGGLGMLARRRTA